MAKRMIAVVQTPPDQMPRIDVNLIPEYVAQSLARSAFEAIRRSLQDPEFVQEYEEWKAEQAQQQKESEVTE